MNLLQVMPTELTLYFDVTVSTRSITNVCSSALTQGKTADLHLQKYLSISIFLPILF